MKKFFQILGMVSLICFSFIYTEKVSNVLKEVDDIMVEIKENSSKYKIDPIDAVIKDDTIIPGLYGREVDLEKSYQKMKRANQYNEQLLVYKVVKPKISSYNKFDKYIISGNKYKNEVSLIFLVNENTDISKIRYIANAREIKVNFFVDGLWLEQNSDLLSDLIKEGHNIGNLSYNNDYKNSYFMWMNTILKKIVKQKNNYCYLENKNQEFLKICALSGNYTIMPNTVIKINPALTVKNNLVSGNIIAFDINEYVENEFNTIITYIKSKGFEIVPLNVLLSEK